jgi:uncharacterized membrane protein
MGTSFETEKQTVRGNGGRRRVPVGTALDEAVRPRARTAATYQQLADSDRGTGGERLANFLGFFSVGLGLAEFAMPGVIARVCGIDPDDDTNIRTMQLMGLREIGHGLAILSNQQPEKAVWSRVAGDALDLAFLGKALSNPDNDRGRTLFATVNVLAVTALDIMCARQLSMQPESEATVGIDEGIIHTRRSITVGKPVEEVYAFWRNFENLPRFMRHLESVTVIDERRSRWVAKAPAGKHVEWDAEITGELENERIAWRSLPGSEIYNAGEVTFRAAPGGRGTEVRVDLEYDPPFGKLGSKVAMLFREEPGQQVRDDLRHFKQVMETGEIILSDATKQRGPHPARPNTASVRL